MTNSNSILTIVIFMLWSTFAFVILQGVYSLLIYALGLEALFIGKRKRENIEKILSNNHYFKYLSEKGKKKFIKRVISFMLYKNFKGAKGFRVNQNNKVLISASAVQLTFGLDSYKLDAISDIVIFPSKFKLINNDLTYKGATLKNALFLSWKDFKSGNDNSDDKINLGIHEMTHALQIVSNRNRIDDSSFLNRIKNWETYLSSNFETLKLKTSSFLRMVPNENTNEFFAIATEAFFEKPFEFQQLFPETFERLAFLLNQNPCNLFSDYQIKRS